MTMDRDARALELQLPLHHLRSVSEAAKCLRLMTERAFGLCGKPPEVDANPSQYWQGSLCSASTNNAKISRFLKEIRCNLFLLGSRVLAPRSRFLLRPLSLMPELKYKWLKTSNSKIVWRPL